MALFQQDLVRTNKRYVTKIVAQDVASENYEGLVIGLTSSAFANFDESGITASDIKLHSVWGTSNSGGLQESGWAVRWGEDTTPLKGDGHDIIFLSGNNVDEFFEQRFSHENTLTGSSQVAVILNNPEARPGYGTIILEFTI